MEPSDQVELRPDLRPCRGAATAHPREGVVERNRQRHQHRDRHGACPADPARAVHDQPLPGHDPIDEPGNTGANSSSVGACMSGIGCHTTRVGGWARSHTR